MQNLDICINGFYGNMVHHKYGEPYYHIYSEKYAPKMRAERIFT